MSTERSFETWEEVQRQSQDLADRLTQGFTGLIHSHITPPSFPWLNPEKPNFFDVEFEFSVPAQSFVLKDFALPIDTAGIDGVSAIIDIGNKIGQAGSDFGSCFNGLVQLFFRSFPLRFKHGEIDNGNGKLCADMGVKNSDIGLSTGKDLSSLAALLREFRGSEDDVDYGGSSDD